MAADDNLLQRVDWVTPLLVEFCKAEASGPLATAKEIVDFVVEQQMACVPLLEEMSGAAFDMLARQSPERRAQCTWMIISDLSLRDPSDILNERSERTAELNYTDCAVLVPSGQEQLPSMLDRAFPIVKIDDGHTLDVWGAQPHVLQLEQTSSMRLVFPRAAGVIGKLIKDGEVISSVNPLKEVRLVVPAQLGTLRMN